MPSTKRFAALLLLLILAAQPLLSLGEAAPALPMDGFSGGAAFSDAGFLSDTQYRDDSISVELFSGRYEGTDYSYAHIKIQHPSQLRTAPASIAYSPTATFKNNATATARQAAKAVSAVIAINGDYYTKPEQCQVMMRMGQQLRNVARGNADILVIDKAGDFHAIQGVTRKGYQEYFALNEETMYQVLTFGPVLVKDGVSLIDERFNYAGIGVSKLAQRTAIAQLGKLEYLLVVTEGPQNENSKGYTVYEMARLVEELGRQFSEEGCILAYNLDGGNSASMIFKHQNAEGAYEYAKVNSPAIERPISDIIYFASLGSP